MEMSRGDVLSSPLTSPLTKRTLGSTVANHSLATPSLYLPTHLDRPRVILESHDPASNVNF